MFFVVLRRLHVHGELGSGGARQGSSDIAAPSERRQREVPVVQLQLVWTPTQHTVGARPQPNCAVEHQRAALQ